MANTIGTELTTDAARLSAALNSALSAAPAIAPGALKVIADSLGVGKKLDPKILKQLRCIEEQNSALWDTVLAHSRTNAKSVALGQVEKMTDGGLSPDNVKGLTETRAHFQDVRAASKNSARSLCLTSIQPALECATVFSDACKEEASKVDMIDRASHQRFGFSYAPSNVVLSLRAAAQAALELAAKESGFASPSARLPWLTF